VLRGLWNLTWLEIKIFAREPLGLVGAVVIPVALFLVLGRVFGPGLASGSARALAVVSIEVPIFAVILIILSAVMSLMTIIAIYREGGILKRLRATPLRPHTILTAHVLVKLLFTLVTMSVLILAGRRYYPVDIEVPWLSFGVALLFSTVSILSLGFLLASLVPTARFAQPIGTLLLYPMVGLSGLFVAIESLPGWLQGVAHVLPLTYAVSLLRGAWQGEPWMAHLGDVAGLVIVFVVCTAISSRVFRWE
jgi:ABC-2 type transport system permease protein